MVIILSLVCIAFCYVKLTMQCQKKKKKRRKRPSVRAVMEWLFMLAELLESTHLLKGPQ